MADITFDDVKAYIYTQASANDLKIINDYCNMRYKHIGATVGNSFQPGDRIWFDAKSKGIIRGKFVRMKTKNAEIISDSGVRWSVFPNFLNKE